MDFSFSHFPFDIILFGLIAAFLVLRLRSILGRRVGAEPQIRPMPPERRPGPVIEGVAEPVPSGTDFDIPAPETRVGQVLAEISRQERDFAPDQFLRGAETSFRQVVEAFAKGDIAMLRERLTPAACTSFEGAIQARLQSGETQRSEIRAITSMAIVDASIASTGPSPVATVEVRIVSDQVSVTLDKGGQPVAGADAVTEFSDLWTFERMLGVTIPGAAWRLAACRSA